MSRNKTNKEIFECLINAAELSSNIEHGTADLYLKIIDGPSPDGNTIGYVNRNSRFIYTYSEFLSSMNVGRLAAHFAHEWTHVMGFYHPEYTEENEHFANRTVPYAVQQLVIRYAEVRMHDFMMTRIDHP